MPPLTGIKAVVSIGEMLNGELTSLRKGQAHPFHVQTAGSQTLFSTYASVSLSVPMSRCPIL